jgi:hypothetical protein
MNKRAKEDLDMLVRIRREKGTLNDIQGKHKDW